MIDKLSFYERSPIHSPLSIISIPTELGSDARGLNATPAYLRKNGLADMLTNIDADNIDEINIPCPNAPAFNIGPLKNLAEIATVSNKISQATLHACNRGEIVLALGGDHSISVGTIRGASLTHSSLGVIYIDAHADAHTDETTTTHNIHGMPAALAMGFGHPQLLGEKRNAVKPENFLYIGLKDFDEAEIDFLRRESPPTHTILDIAERGLSPIFASIAALSRRVKKIWISMDMDSIDRAYAPGVAMPNTSGLTAREALSIAQYVGKQCDIAGLDIVEMLPTNDVENKTAGLAIELIARFLGSEYSWYQKYMKEYEATNKASLLRKN